MLGKLYSPAIVIFLVAIALAATGKTVNAEDIYVGDIFVEISGAESDQGKILWRVFADENDFSEPESGGVFEGACEISAHGCTFVIPNVRFGNYALMAGHDINGDLKISRNPLSDEKKGISNYYEKLYWYPDFEKAKFMHTGQSTLLKVETILEPFWFQCGLPYAPVHRVNVPSQPGGILRHIGCLVLCSISATSRPY